MASGDRTQEAPATPVVTLVPLALRPRRGRDVWRIAQANAAAFGTACWARGPGVLSSAWRAPATGLDESGPRRAAGPGAIVYSLTVFGSVAEQLVETAQASGNVRVLFAGSYRVRGYDRHVGGTGISHNVMVDEIDVSLTGQRVVDWSRRRNGGEA